VDQESIQMPEAETSTTTYDADLDRLLDQALADSFPASDPISISFSGDIVTRPKGRKGPATPLRAAAKRLEGRA
jgi:hypothetical protein